MEIKNVIFMGTPQFGVPTLELLSKTKYKPVLCITQPDRPKGRKQKLSSPEIKITAEKLEIPIIQPENVNDIETIKLLKKIEPDIIITVAYGGYLKKEIRKLSKFGCINLHPSLLPKYRGSAPINYTLLNGDKVGGNTIFRIVAKMDAGPILSQNKTVIGINENYTELYEKLSKAGAKSIIKLLENLELNKILEKKQDENKVSFSNKINNSDLIINWVNPAVKINNQIRAFAEKPATFTYFREKKLKIIEAEVLEEKSEKKIGLIIKVIKNRGIVVSTADFNLLIKRLQPAGKSIMSAFAFSLGAKFQKNECFQNGE
ncbi:MAG: methionyl-tRNA formyltransferase [Candidatus Cloacimonetes bacterium]|jgi:methionyl-tRNA formyltransferase|nr:methionyl-tRNA formyltransferase [Candidatus Cloacimonadota bacterium]MBT6993677.1 methionyl-tRNA formyltransferase [Candidatus Cloacimonadota bacterium]MBT7469910.1 methionyl-tRNA formyltransferase [Candidatus Cloacimonadota bacterium]